MPTKVRKPALKKQLEQFGVSRKNKHTTLFSYFSKTSEHPGPDTNFENILWIMHATSKHTWC